MKVSLNFQNSILPASFGLNKANSNPISFAAQQDEFVRTDKKELYLQKLNKLFPAGGIDAIYNRICVDFKVEYPPKLKFSTTSDGVMAGGFTYQSNEINMSLDELLGFEYKLVGIKNGKKLTLLSPSSKIPAFADKARLELIAKLHNQRGSMGFDKLVVEHVTDDDLRRFVVQKLSHEVIHAQQHMIMRRTRGIGSKEIIKAWTHIKPKNEYEKMRLQKLTEELYNRSFWAGKKTIEGVLDKNLPAAKLAYIWLDAIRNYPKVDSPEYMKNAIEMDAYERSYKYVSQVYGGY